jgi:hypothetical protein
VNKPEDTAEAPTCSTWAPATPHQAIEHIAEAADCSICGKPIATDDDVAVGRFFRGHFYQACGAHGGEAKDAGPALDRWMRATLCPLLNENSVPHGHAFRHDAGSCVRCIADMHPAGYPVAPIHRERRTFVRHCSSCRSPEHDLRQCPTLVQAADVAEEPLSSAFAVQRYVEPRHVDEALADVEKWVEQHQQELRADPDPEKRVRASAWAFVERNFTSKPEDVWPNALELAGRSLAFMARSDAAADVLMWINSHSGRLEELGDGERLERRVDQLADWIFYYAVYIDLEGARDGALEMAALATFFMARSRA